MHLFNGVILFFISIQRRVIPNEIRYPTTINDSILLRMTIASKLPQWSLLFEVFKNLTFAGVRICAPPYTLNIRTPLALSTDPDGSSTNEKLSEVKRKKIKLSLV